MEQQQTNTNAGQGLGIAGLVIGIISFVLAFIPCVGVIAVIPGILAVVLSAIGLSQAQKAKSPKGLMIGGLVVAVIALLISISQVIFGVFLAREGGNWGDRIESIIEEVETDLERDLDKNFTITVETDDEAVRIERGDKEKELKNLEELEGEKEIKKEAEEKEK